MRALAVRLGGTADAYFEAFCLLRARLHGKERWAEKTPRHAFRIAEMLEAFPNAKIVCLVRDPRAVVASYRDWHRGGERPGLEPEDEAGLAAERARSKRSYHPILASLLWRGVIHAEYEALERFGGERIRLERFEDLVAAPESVGASALRMARDRVRAADARDPGRQQLVRRRLGPRGRRPLAGEAAAARARTSSSGAAATLMEEIGYARESPRMSLPAYAVTWLSVPYVSVRAALAYRRRLGNAVDYVRRRGTLAFSKGSLPR